MSEWKQSRLADLAEIRTSNVDKKSYPRQLDVRLCSYMDVYSHDYITGGIRFMLATATSAEAQRFRVEKGDVLLTKDSEKPDDIGIPSVVTEQIDNLVCGYHLALLKPHKDRIDPVYLAKQLATTETATYFACYANGSTRYGLSSGSLAATPIQVAPLKQQRCIAEILSTLDEAVEQTEALIAKTQQIKTGLMHDLFTRGVTSDGQLRPPREQAPQLYKESPLGWIPKEWKTIVLNKSAIAIIDGDRGVHYPKDSELRDAGDSLFLSAHNVTRDGFKFKKKQFITAEKHERLGTGSLRRADIVITTRGTVGNIAYFDDSVPFPVVRINSGMVILRSNESGLYTEFLYRSLKDYVFVREYHRVISGSAQPQLPIRDLKHFHALVPHPDEQQRLVARGIAIDERINEERKKLSGLCNLKRGLMQDLLTGRVRVPAHEDAEQPKQAAASVSG